LPGGADTAFNQVLLQAPGVAQDSFGGIHVRGEHNNLQYRLNGVILPEGISVFGQSLSPRLADSVELITGALPAEYGLRTAGIVDITTKAGAFNPGGEVGVYGGSNGLIEPSFEMGGSAGQINYFVSGSYKQSGLGIESPDGRANPLHDRTQQGQGFGYFEDILNEANKVSLIFGTSRNQFQIPNQSGMQPSLGLSVAGQTAYPSAQLSESQRESTSYTVLSVLHTEDKIDLQTSVFGRLSSLNYTPDVLGDLLFNGIAQYAQKNDTAGGIQTEAAYRVADHHTLRSGVIIEGDRGSSNTLSKVLPVDPVTGQQTSNSPLSIADKGGKTAWTYSFYLQDEWKILPDFTVNYGGRFDLVDAYIHEQQVSPRVNLVWQATPATNVHAGYSRYFTPPPFELVGEKTINLFNNTTGASPTGVTLDTPTKSERANYYDLGISQKVIPALTVGLDSYFKSSTRLIDEGQFGAPIILTPFNYAEGRQYGVELSLSYQQGPWNAYGNFAVSRAIGKNIDSAEFNFSADDLTYISGHWIHLDHDQTYTASGGVSYRWEQTRLSADLLVQSGLRADEVLPDGKSIPNGASLSLYSQVNLGIVQFVTLPKVGKFKLRGDIINLFDNKYEIRNGTGVGVGAPQFGPRRGFFAGVSKTF
jgi:outer membrane receptor protein involved in Fe transport